MPTEAGKQALVSAADILYETLSLYHPNWPDVLHLVKAPYNITETNITATLETNEIVTFIASAIQINPPKKGDTGHQDLTFAIPNVALEIPRRLEMIENSLDAIKLSVRAFVASDLSQPCDTVYHLDVSNASLTETVLNVSARYANFVNRTFQNIVYDAVTAPGLIR